MGTSLAQTMQKRRDQFHTLRLRESLDCFQRGCGFPPGAGSECSYSRPAIQLPRSNWPGQALESPHQEQASSFAYFDVFLMLTVVTLGLVPMVLDETPGGPERRHIAGE